MNSNEEKQIIERKKLLNPVAVVVALYASITLGYFVPSFAGDSSPVSEEVEQAKVVHAEFKMDDFSEDAFANYCYDCHDDSTQKGDLRLDNLSSLTLEKRLAVLNKVQEQVYLKNMPPKKKSQPEKKERSSLLTWLGDELNKHNASTLAEKLKKPHYANYVDHEMLFSGEIKEEAFSPARLWRRSPYHFDHTKRTVFGDSRNERHTVGEVHNIKQPFNKGGGEGISDYASLFYADSATFDTLHRNAVFIVDRTLLMAFIEFDYKSQGKTMEDWKVVRAKVLQKQKDQIEEFKKQGKTTRYIGSMHRQVNAKYRLPTPQVYRDIILGEGTPTDAMIEAAINYHFDRTVQQEATEEDLVKYSAFMKEGIEESGVYFGLRNTLIAILCSPKFIYRSELGLGESLEDGRSMLSPAELTYAVSYALTDKKPSKELLDAAKNGKLTSREDVKREVTKMLADDSMEKPRILRFFHEFFGYHHAPEIFKDDNRFFKGYTFHKSAKHYVKDTDTLINHILKKDKDVFKELLTTDKYFVAHDGDNEAVRALVEAHKKLYAYFKDKDWKNYAKNAKKKIEPEKKDIDYAMSLHPLFRAINTRLNKGHAIHSRMIYIEYYEKKGITAASYSVGRSTPNILNSLMAYNLPGRDWDYAVEQPFVLAKGKRAGILSHPSWLIAHSLNSHTDPVRRGKWIREFLLAGTIPDVPITVDATIPEDHHKTLRERYSVTEAKKCWKCHVSMNPLGYPFEVFDDFGRWRDKENLEGLPKIKGAYETRPINSKGYLDGTGDESLDGDVTDAHDLVIRLAKSRRVQQSIIRHAFRYWMGRNELLTDSKTLIRAEKAYMESGGSFNALLVSLLTSDSFIYRKRLDSDHP